MIIYLLSLIISAFILYLINIDLKKFKIKIYNELTLIIWIKLYSLIIITFIHLIWIFNILFYKNNDIIYGLPNILIFPYIIFILAEYYKKNETIVSEKINRYLNYLISLYFIIIIIIIYLPNEFKIKLINYIKNILYENLTKLRIIFHY
jgi:hypothetical protein